MYRYQNSTNRERQFCTNMAADLIYF